MTVEEMGDVDAMMFPSGSALQRLPSNLDKHQAKYLDGIRYAGNTAGLAYARLVAALGVASENEPDEPQAFLYAAILLDAWAFVDSAFRMGKLLAGMRGMKRTPGVELMLRHLDQYEALRHGVQHLEGTIVNRLDEPEPVWGSLSWFLVGPGDHPDVTMFIFAPGHLRDVETAPVLSPGGRGFRAPIDNVELSAFGATATISETFWRLKRFTSDFDALLQREFDGYDTPGSDLLMRIELTPVVEPER